MDGIKPKTQKEIATDFNMSLGSIKNFMFRHDLNKKNYYAKTKEKVMENVDGVSMAPKGIIYEIRSEDNHYSMYYMNDEVKIKVDGY